MDRQISGRVKITTDQASLENCRQDTSYANNVVVHLLIALNVWSSCGNPSVSYCFHSQNG